MAAIPRGGRKATMLNPKASLARGSADPEGGVEVGEEHGLGLTDPIAFH